MNTKSQHFKHLGSSWVWQLALHSVEVYKRVLNLTEVFWRPVALHIIGSKQSRSIKKSSVHLKVSVNFWLLSMQPMVKQIKQILLDSVC